MNTKFHKRERMTLEEAQKAMKLGGYIRHILDNQDGTYSLMGHINCEHCDYCDQHNKWWDEHKKNGLTYEQIKELPYPVFLPQEDPYAEQKLIYPSNYGPSESRYMTLIEDKEVFEWSFPYKGSKPDIYPKRYPCLVNWEQKNGGIVGDSYTLKIIYIPKDVDQKSFIRGVQADAAIFAVI